MINHTNYFDVSAGSNYDEQDENLYYKFELYMLKYVISLNF